MSLKVGCDIISIGRFEQSAKNGGKEFLQRIFSASELANTPNIETLAGMFAAKEAVMKALGETVPLQAGDWKKIVITKKRNGRPEVQLPEWNDNIVSRDVSISHDQEYAMAVAVFMVTGN